MMLFRHKKSFFARHKYSLALLFLAAAVVVIAVFLGDSLGFAFKRNEIEAYFRELGFWAPLIYIAIIAIEVVVAPLPGGVLTVAAAVVFGPVLGTLYSWVGNILGSLVAFALARRFGMRVIKYFMPHFDERQYHADIQEHQGLFWISYVLPVFPVDIFSFAFGLSDIKMKRFFLFMSSGFLVRMSLTSLFGSSLGDIFFI